MTMQFIVTLLICLLANYGHYSEMNIGFSANVLMLISSQVAMNLCTHYAIAKTNSVANELIIQVAFISIAAIMIAIDNKAFTARNIYICFTDIFLEGKKLFCHGQPRIQKKKTDFCYFGKKRPVSFVIFLLFFLSNVSFYVHYLYLHYCLFNY